MSEQSHSSWVSALVASGAKTVFVYPLVLLTNRRQYNGESNVRIIYKTQGIKGLWRGCSAMVIGDSIQHMMEFGAYHEVRQVLNLGNNTTWLISGALAGIAQTVAMTPFEHVRIKTQTLDQKTRHIVRNIYQEHGMRGFYKGCRITLVKNIPDTAIYFWSYEQMQKRMENYNTVTRALIAGGFAGAISCLAVYPADTVKSNIHCHASQRGNEWQQVKEISMRLYRQGGVRAFFPGLGLSLTRSIYSNAILFLFFEWSEKWLKGSVDSCS